MPVVELLFAAYFTGALVRHRRARIYTSVFFIVLFQAALLRGHLQPAAGLSRAAEDLRRGDSVNFRRRAVRRVA